jgi:hypothetical protein
MFRFLPGLIIIQAATAVLVLLVMETPMANWLLYSVLALALSASFLTAFWFASIASHIKKDALARMREGLIRERERLLMNTEKEKNRVFEKTQRRIIKETNRAHAKASFKVGAAVIGAVGLGIGLLSFQFMTVGLLTLLTAGGAMTGYLVRARQEHLVYKGNKANSHLPQRQSIELIEAETSGPNPPALEKKL